MRKGILMLVCAEFCFAAATVFVKFVTRSSEIPPLEITFARFIIGFAFAYILLKKSNSSLVPEKKTFMIWRGVLNTVAVILFFTSVKYTTIANANMLNMTYPIFIFLFAPFFGKEKADVTKIIFLFISIVGVYLVIQPNFAHLLYGDIIGLLSGIIGAASILSLRRARETDSTLLILFYVMGVGTLINGLLLAPVFVTPNSTQLILILISAVLGVAGQVFVTYGYKYIEATKGGIVSSSRIIFAVIMGILIFDERFNLKLALGALLILWAIVSISLHEYRQNKALKTQA